MNVKLQVASYHVFWYMQWMGLKTSPAAQTYFIWYIVCVCVWVCNTNAKGNEAVPVITARLHHSYKHSLWDLKKKATEAQRPEIQRDGARRPYVSSAMKR